MVISGSLEVLGALPLFETLSDDPSEIEEVLHDYIVKTNDGGSFRLDLSLLPNKKLTSPTASDWAVSVEGYQPDHLPSSSIVVLEVGIGLASDPYVSSEETGVYKAKEKGSFLYEPLFVLMDFRDGENACGGREGLKELVYSGSKNVKDLFEEFSNDRASLSLRDGDYDHHIAGPYKFDQFRVDQPCDSYYIEWRNAARQAAINDGYNMTQYSTIITVHPEISGCRWAGRASLATCVPRSSGLHLPWCFGGMNLCQAFVFSHEMGHNMLLQHSGRDIDDDDSVDAADVFEFYADWSCLMGNRNSWNMLNAVKLYQKGWIDDDKMCDLAGPGSYLLSSLDLPADEAPHLQIVTFEDNSVRPAKQYFFSVRSRHRYAFNLESRYLNGINIHYKVSTDERSFFVNRLLDGESHIGLYSRFVFTQVNHTSESALLRIIPAECADRDLCPYSWREKEWSDCSSICRGGFRTRRVECMNGTQVIDDGWCVTANEYVKPLERESCNDDKDCAFHWETTEWVPLTCPSCSNINITQSRSVDCVDTVTNEYLTDEFCVDYGIKPNTTSLCEDIPLCLEWKVTSWSQCNATCGGGYQAREVECFSSETERKRPDSECTHSKSGIGPRPVSSRECNTEVCSPCFFQDCNHHGVCEEFDNEVGFVCECGGGWYGETCQHKPIISSVSLQFEEDVDNPYAILWESQGDIDVVTILARERDRSLPLIIAQDVSNSGSFRFSVDDSFPNAGVYVFEVRFSAIATATSIPHSINPCEFKSCRNGGRCIGGVCVCSSLCSGDICEVCTDPVDPCQDLGCQNGGTCDPDALTCDCSTTPDGSFSGVLCEKPPSCSLDCQHNSVASSDCSKCDCDDDSFFKGTLCDQCILDNLCAEGEPDEGCVECVCERGFTGERCNLPYYRLEIGPLSLSKTDWDEEPYASLARTALGEDLARALDIEAERVSVQSVASDRSSISHSYVTFWLIGDLDGGSYGSSRLELLDLISTLEDELADEASKFYTGSVTGTAEPSTVVLEAVDGRTAVASLSPSNDSSSMMIAVIVGVGTFLVVLLAVSMVMYKRRSKQYEEAQVEIARRTRLHRRLTQAYLSRQGTVQSIYADEGMSPGEIEHELRLSASHLPGRVQRMGSSVRHMMAGPHYAGASMRSLQSVQSVRFGLGHQPPPPPMGELQRERLQKRQSTRYIREKTPLLSGENKRRMRRSDSMPVSLEEAMKRQPPPPSVPPPIMYVPVFVSSSREDLMAHTAGPIYSSQEVGEDRLFMTPVLEEDGSPRDGSSSQPMSGASSPRSAYDVHSRPSSQHHVRWARTAEEELDAKEVEVELDPDLISPVSSPRSSGKLRSIELQKMRAEEKRRTEMIHSFDLELPHGWYRYFTADGVMYYANEITGESQWTPPHETQVYRDDRRERDEEEEELEHVIVRPSSPHRRAQSPRASRRPNPSDDVAVSEASDSSEGYEDEGA